MSCRHHSSHPLIIYPVSASRALLRPDRRIRHRKSYVVAFSNSFPWILWFLSTFSLSLSSSEREPLIEYSPPPVGSQEEEERRKRRNSQVSKIRDARIDILQLVELFQGNQGLFLPFNYLLSYLHQLPSLPSHLHLLPSLLLTTTPTYYCCTAHRRESQTAQFVARSPYTAAFVHEKGKYLFPSQNTEEIHLPCRIPLFLILIHSYALHHHLTSFSSSSHSLYRVSLSLKGLSFPCLLPPSTAALSPNPFEFVA